MLNALDVEHQYTHREVQEMIASLGKANLAPGYSVHLSRSSARALGR